MTRLENQIFSLIYLAIAFLWPVMAAFGIIGFLRFKRIGILLQAIGAGTLFLNALASFLLPFLLSFLHSSAFSAYQLMRLVGILLFLPGLALLVGGFVLDLLQQMRHAQAGPGFPVYANRP